MALRRRRHEDGPAPEFSKQSVIQEVLVRSKVVRGAILIALWLRGARGMQLLEIRACGRTERLLVVCFVHSNRGALNEQIIEK